MAEAMTLYRFYSHDGRLLYVGITSDPTKRFEQHREDKPWWHEVSGITLEQIDGRKEALAAEARAIRVEQPVHNVVRPTVRGPRRLRLHEAAIDWRCDVCGRSISKAAGYVSIPYAEVNEAEAADRAWRRACEDPLKPTTGDVLDARHLPVAQWRALHERCDPEPEGNDYWIPIEELQSASNVLHWTLHLMGKGWFPVTSWPGFVARTGAASRNFAKVGA